MKWITEADRSEETTIEGVRSVGVFDRRLPDVSWKHSG